MQPTARFPLRGSHRLFQKAAFKAVDRGPRVFILLVAAGRRDHASASVCSFNSCASSSPNNGNIKLIEASHLSVLIASLPAKRPCSAAGNAWKTRHLQPWARSVFFAFLCPVMPAVPGWMVYVTDWVWAGRRGLFTFVDFCADAGTSVKRSTQPVCTFIHTGTWKCFIKSLLTVQNGQWSVYTGCAKSPKTSFNVIRILNKQREYAYLKRLWFFKLTSHVGLQPWKLVWTRRLWLFWHFFVSTL